MCYLVIKIVKIKIIFCIVKGVGFDTEVARINVGASKAVMKERQMIIFKYQVWYVLRVYQTQDTHKLKSHIFIPITQTITTKQ